MPETVEAEQQHGSITIQRVRYRNSRFYRVLGDPRVDGLKLPGATTVLNVLAKPALIPWANRMGREAVAEYLTPFVGQILTQEALAKALAEAKDRPDEVKDTAANTGTRAHTLLQEFVEGKTPDVPTDLQPVVDGYLQLRKSNPNLTFSFAELMVYCPECKYAGTADGIGERNGKPILFDYKTSNAIYEEEYSAQLAAYMHAWEKMGNPRPEEGWIFRFGKRKAELEVAYLQNYPAALELFQGALQVWKTQKTEFFTRERKATSGRKQSGS